MADIMGGMISIVIYVLIIGLIFSFLMEIISPFRGVIRKKTYLSRDAGERLKKYIINAVRLNKNACKELKLRRTKYASGGKIGKIYGALASKFVTVFVIKRTMLSGKQIIFVPIDYHSSLLCKSVVISAVALTNSAGVYYPIPFDKTQKKKLFDLMGTQYTILMNEMFITDLRMITPSQIEMAIAGREPIERIIREVPEEIKEEVIEG